MVFTATRNGAAGAAAGAAVSTMDIKDAVKATTEAETGKLWGMLPMWCKTLGALFLVVVPPYFVILFWYILVEMDGSIAALAVVLKENGARHLVDIVPNPVDWDAWKYILSFG